MNHLDSPTAVAASKALLVVPFPATSASTLAVAVPAEDTDIAFAIVDASGTRHPVAELAETAARPVFLDLVRTTGAEAACWSKPSDTRMTVGANLPLWHLPDVETTYLYSKAPEAWRQASVELVDPGSGGPVRVDTRREYTFRVLAAVHRCTGRIVVSVVDATGVALCTDEFPIDPSFRGGESRALYHAIEARIAVPENGHAVQIRAFKSATKSKRDSYLFLADPRLHEVHASGSFDVVSVSESRLAALRAEHGAHVPALRRASLPLPAALASLDSRAVRVWAESADRESLSAPIEIPTVSLPGELRGVLDGVAFGVVQLPPATSSSELVATCNGAPCKVELEADRSSGDELVRVPFRIALPSPLPIAADTPMRLDIHREGTLDAMTGSPFLITRASSWGELEGVHGLACVGWATSVGRLRPPLELLVDGVVASSFVPDVTYAPFVAEPRGRSRVGFRVPLPESALDGDQHDLAIRFAESRALLSPGTRAFRFAPEGSLDRVGPSGVEGWIVNPDSDDAPLALDVLFDGVIVGTTETTLHRADVAQAHGRRFAGFQLQLDATWARHDAPIEVELRLAGTTARVLGPKRVTLSTFRAIESLERWASDALRLSAAHDGPLDGEAFVRELLRTRLVPTLLEEWRTALRDGSKSLDWPRRSPRPRPDAARPVDVIIPVYKGLAETLACIASALEAACTVPLRVVAINDASPDAALTLALRELAETTDLVLLENPKNLGFVATANRGMRLSPESDVVLLNADTLVPRGWLDTLVDSAYARADIGTVTPLSNRATICSVPRPNFDNAMPEGFDVEAMNRLCQEHGGGGLVDLPSAIGFCMYIRRDALDEVGYFDETRWKKGYGEENDFSVRARARGYRSVATTSCFVQHHGAVSFAGEKAARVRENSRALQALYPDYHDTVHAFIAADPIRPFRNRINAALVASSGSPHVLHIVHDRGGGTITAVEQMTRNLERHGYRSLVASPKGASGVLIRNSSETIALEYDFEDSGAALVECLRAMNVVLIHVHHVAAFDPVVLDVIESSSIPYVVTLHDYFFACPRVDLRDSNGQFCDLATPATCDGCVNSAPVPDGSVRLLARFDRKVERWRNRFGELLAGARAAYAPSDDARSRLTRAFPGMEITTRPHPDRRDRRPLELADVVPHSLAVIGGVGEQKGYRLLLALARHAEAVKSPLRITIVGYTRDDGPFERLGNVRITGRYEREELAGLIRDSGASVALFLSPTSETYSYALSEAFEFGLYPVALDRGAFRERIEDARFGEVLPVDIGVAALHDELMGVFARRHGETSGPVDPWRRSPEFYYDGLLAPLTAPATPVRGS